MMRVYRRVFILSVMVALVACWAVAPVEADSNVKKNSKGQIIIKAGHHTAKDSFFQVGFEYFGKRLNELSGNKFEMQIYPAAQLGNQTELIQQLQKGSVQMSTSSMADLGNYSPIVNIMDIPFIFRSKDHAWAVADGPIGAMMKARVEQEADVMVMGWWSIGVRSVFSSKGPVTKPEDLSGLKIRTQPNPSHVAAFKVMGAMPTPIAYPELYNALQQKVVDAAENDPTNMLQMKFYEPCKYFSLTEHFTNVAGAAVMMSKKFYYELDPYLQTMVLQAAKEATQYQRQWTEDFGVKAMEELKKLHVKINEVDKDAFQKAAMPFYQEYAYPKFGKEMVDTVANWGK